MRDREGSAGAVAGLDFSLLGIDEPLTTMEGFSFCLLRQPSFNHSMESVSSTLKNARMDQPCTSSLRLPVETEVAC